MCVKETTTNYKVSRKGKNMCAKLENDSETIFWFSFMHTPNTKLIFNSLQRSGCDNTHTNETKLLEPHGHMWSDFECDSKSQLKF
jgi:hypothetical protein